jgi:hypothetical protein
VIRENRGRSESPATQTRRIARYVLVEVELPCPQGEERTDLRRRTEGIRERLAAGKRKRSPESTVDLRDDPRTARLGSSGKLRQLLESSAVARDGKPQPDHGAGIQARGPRTASLVHRRPEQLSRPNAAHTTTAVTNLGCSSCVDKGNSSYC